jgi:hypothetical protein
MLLGGHFYIAANNYTPAPNLNLLGFALHFARLMKTRLSADLALEDRAASVVTVLRSVASYAVPSKRKYYPSAQSH